MNKALHHKDLEKNIGYKFKNTDLLLDVVQRNNKGAQSKNSFERLEFLGDRVLSLVISDLLLTKFPVANEGDLSRRLVGLIRRETLAVIAKSIATVSYTHLRAHET